VVSGRSERGDEQEEEWRGEEEVESGRRARGRSSERRPREPVDDDGAHVGQSSAGRIRDEKWERFRFFPSRRNDDDESKG
jgi:hypothetical protein